MEMNQKRKKMSKLKYALSIVLLVAALTALGATGTHFAIRLDLWLSVPVIVALWAGLALVGVNVYERGK